MCADNSFSIKGLTNLVWKLNDAIFVLFIGDRGITIFCSPVNFHEKVGKVNALFTYYVLYMCLYCISVSVYIRMPGCVCVCVCVGCVVVSVCRWSNSSVDAQTTTTRNRSFAQVSTRKVSMNTDWARHKRDYVMYKFVTHVYDGSV